MRSTEYRQRVEVAEDWRAQQRVLAERAIHRWHTALGSDARLCVPKEVLPGREQQITALLNEETIGHLVFEVAGDQMTLVSMRVHSDFRGKGTARALIASAILFVPQGIRFLRSELGEMNARIFGEAEQRTRSFEEALKATPAYRGRRALGFGRIIPVLNDPFERVRLCTEFDGCE